MKSAQGYGRRWRSKIFSIFGSGGHIVYRSKKILAIFLGSHLGNIPEKFESHWPKGLGGDSIKFVVALLFYLHGKHLRSCRDGQLT